ncbi:hypothetical protein [Methylopila sp. M107]|uniref:hypothetical protein n=1 Tax=Methylopila sp. M107 TaxID=1101190 RepID=UPI001AEC153B|nr:hypothetical protein [Methylopila sp. M107]
MTTVRAGAGGGGAPERLNIASSWMSIGFGRSRRSEASHFGGAARKLSFNQHDVTPKDLLVSARGPACSL